MSYNAYDLSANQGNPYYLYRFERQGVQNDFTNLEIDHTHATLGGPFLARAISHENIHTGDKIRKSELPIILPESDSFAREFLGILDPGVTSVTIWRGHLEDPDDEMRVIFKGKLINATPQRGGRINLNCISSIFFLQNKGLRPRVQRTCRHVLYHGLCRLNLADFQVADAATAIDGNTYTITNAGAQSDGWWAGGVLEYAGQFAFVIRHVGDQVTVRLPISSLNDEIDLDGSADVLLAPGCNRSAAHCENKFGNLLNFGGFPNMPLDDPFGGKSIK